MGPQEFLAAVLPSAGFFCIAEFTSKKNEHVFAPTLAELEPHIERLHHEKKDVYFALSTFTENTNRTAENALHIKAFFMDIEGGAGKEYATKKEAAQALDKFLQDSGLAALGNPWLVGSGGGIHAYWPLTEEVSIATWKPVAESLKRLCKKHDFVIDFSVTADAARVLRVPGTTNWKKIYGKPRPVVLKHTAGLFSFDEFSSIVRPLNGAEVAAELIPGERLPPSANAVRMLENSVTSFKAILAGGCKQLEYYIAHASEDGMEPLWRGLLSIAKPCVDGDKAARKLSAMHPYAEERMLTKLREIKGPYPCTKFETENPGGCKDCKHRGKITNPLALGRETVTNNAEQTLFIQTPSSSQPILLKKPSPPKGFSYGAAGGIYKNKEDQDDDGNPIFKATMILPYDLFAVDILLNPDLEHSVHLLAMRAEGPTDIILPQKSIVSAVETVKGLAAQNILSAFGQSNDANLFAYVRGCVENMSTEKLPVKVPSHYGWQEDDSFVLNGKIYHENGETAVPMLGLENLKHATKSKGTLENWCSVIDLLITKEYYDVLAMSLVGFGAPLMEFTGLSGVTWHTVSTESGFGKSISLDVAASIWGDPKVYKVGKGTSQVALEQRLGLLRNLPLVTDEITNKAREDFEWFPSFLLSMTEGRGKERMESGANRERLNTTSWFSAALFSSNIPGVDHLTGARKHSSEGELRRLLEYSPTTKISWTPSELKIMLRLASNYGVAGALYTQWLVRNRALASDLTQQMFQKVKKDFNCGDDERFWVAGVACNLAAAVILSPLHANIVAYPVQELIPLYHEIVKTMQGHTSKSLRTAEDILSSYLREYYGKLVIVRATEGQQQVAIGDKKVVDESTTKTEIYGRVEHGQQVGYVHMFFEEALLKSYCAQHSFGYADFKRQMENIAQVSYGKKDMLSGTRGPQMRVNVIHIVRPIGEVDALPVVNT